MQGKTAVDSVKTTSVDIVNHVTDIVLRQNDVGNCWFCVTEIGNRNKNVNYSESYLRKLKSTTSALGAQLLRKKMWHSVWGFIYLFGRDMWFISLSGGVKKNLGKPLLLLIKCVLCKGSFYGSCWKGEIRLFSYFIFFVWVVPVASVRGHKYKHIGAFTSFEVSSPSAPPDDTAL